ncbi:MAG TPA: DUF192 domain-containing protein [Allocoleopsis sp.]
MTQLRMPAVTLDRVGIAIGVLLLGCMGFYAYIAYAQRKFISSYPRSATIVTSSGATIATVEVQVSPEGQVKGLSGRTQLEPGSGMLFPVQPAKLVQVWMKDMKFPLDIVFVKDGKVIQTVENAPPCKTVASTCPVYNSVSPVDTVIELHPESSIKPGTELRVNYKSSSKSEN